ncbi:HAD-IC family P-type ATPase, partial [Rhodovulum sulfidophilum]|nr:HAD-IC family P-type ATPase [Rhodovulum sulfidophilum]
ETDRSLLTGETLPAFAGPGMALSAGEVNLTGPLAVTVTAAGQDSSLHRMADLVAVAESSRNRYTSLADRAARIYAPGVHLLSLLAFLVWLWISGGDLRLALNIAVAVLIITCPCALGLAVPAVTTAASGRLFRRGLLIKDGTALERLAEIDAVVFDKTGTLTEGRPQVTGIVPLEGRAADEVLRLAGAVETGSSHPLARAI